MLILHKKQCGLLQASGVWIVEFPVFLRTCVLFLTRRRPELLQHQRTTLISPQ